MKDYLDFDLHIERTDQGYRARVLNSPSGQASDDFDVPFSDLEVENFWLRVGRTRTGVRRLSSPEMATAEQFGARLFRSVFSGDVYGCLHSSLAEADQQEAGLRIRLRLSDTPELVDLPWEYLYNPSVNRFLSLSVETPLVRYLDFPGRIEPLAVEPPLRVLVMISSPHDYPALDVEQEWEKLRESVADLERRGLLYLERLEESTLVALQHRLRRGQFHIFHYIGHGGFDPQAEDGMLLLEDEQGRGRSVSGQYLGMLLHDHRTMRLALLNACEGARTSRTDPFAGVGQNLLQQGIPAVIAMQSEITDNAAITLANEFYSALADGYPVDAALSEARKAIFAQENDVEWGTPVLFLRAPDGRIFDVGTATVEAAAGASVAGPGVAAAVVAAGQQAAETSTPVPRVRTAAAVAARTSAVASPPEAGHQAVARPASPPAGTGGARGRKTLWLALAAILALLVVGVAAFMVGQIRGGEGEMALNTPEPQASVIAAIPTEAPGGSATSVLAEVTATHGQVDTVSGALGDDDGSDNIGAALPSPRAKDAGGMPTDAIGITVAIAGSEALEEATEPPPVFVAQGPSPTDSPRPTEIAISAPVDTPTIAPTPTLQPTQLPTPEATATVEPTETPAPTQAPKPTAPAPVVAGRMAYSAKGRLYIVDAATGQEKVPPIEDMRQPNFQSNGTKLLANGEGSRATIVNIDATTGAIVRDQGTFTDDFRPYWSPDGSRFVYDSLHSGLGKANKLYVQEVTGTNKPQPDVQLTFDGYHLPGTSPVWMDNQQIVYTGCDYWPGGSGGNSCGIFSVPEGGGRPTLIHEDTVDARATDTHGSQLVYMSRASGDWEVYLLSRDGGASRNLSQSPGSHDGLGTFSPDGKAVAFMSSRDGSWAIWAVNLEGSGLTRLFDLPDVPTEPWYEDAVSWGP
jgi:hypothetical protein